MVYSATATTYYGSTNIGMYWGGSTSEKAGNVFLYLAVPAIDLLHILAQTAAYLSTTTTTTTSPKSESNDDGNPTAAATISLLHPAAALSGALVSFCLWAYQAPVAAVMDFIGWEQPGDAAWSGLAVARCVLGVAVWILWAVYAGYGAAAVHRWRTEGSGTAGEEGRARGWGWDEGRRREAGGEEGLELGGLGGAAARTSKVSGETMVDVELDETGYGGRKV
ncbi:hypothetical protein SLS58_009672 [Diplodia intermedia]|uniref:Uncharacterized protein n=1 Tax=Diplodia intermedia TaxID=856260 RepID=A0ABR3TAV0_9PEZI